MFTQTFALYALISICASGQVLWKEPPEFTTSDWKWGPGGQELAPQPPFNFVKEKLTGTNPKIVVQDAAGRRWVIKFGAEAHTDTFLARLVSALGYAAEPTYFVATGTVRDMHGLKRAKHFIAKNGFFRDARFKLDVPRAEGEKTDRAWSWADNPFVGTRQLGGLKILVMLTSDWDTKDARNGEDESNTGMIRPVGNANSDAWYAVTDWGASLGRAGFALKRDRWDWQGYRRETPGFVRASSDGELHWRYKGRHGDDITAGVGVEDVRWILRYLARITDEDLETGLLASGASEPVAREYARLIRERIGQLEQVAHPDPQRAAK